MRDRRLVVRSAYTETENGQHRTVVYVIRKEWTFDAAHHLDGLPADHKCRRVHGHTYTVEVVFTADQLSDIGFVTDYGDLAPVKAYIDAHLDHRDLNEVLDVPPTAENLAGHLARWCRTHVEPHVPGQLAGVIVKETPVTAAEVWLIPARRHGHDGGHQVGTDRAHACGDRRITAHRGSKQQELDTQHAPLDGPGGAAETDERWTGIRSAVPTKDTLVIAELFGPTVQGEGPSAGREAAFVRLGGCNLTCDWPCDSAFTWDADHFNLRTELRRTPVEQIVGELLGCDTPIVVITGGEPLLHQNQAGWRRLLPALSGKHIEVETNGTIAPTPFTLEHVTQFNVSPKLAFAGDPEHRRIRPGALTALNNTDKANFKFVCRAPADVDEAAGIAIAHGISRERVWIMPEGSHADAVNATLRDLAARAIAHRFNLTTRLHILLWGDERGR